jgi:hypothetical protein
MRGGTTGFGGFAACWLVAIATYGQEGFPLDGTWRGERSSSAEDQMLIVMVMKWDGQSINGTINPGPGSIPFTSATLNPSDWTVRIEAEMPDGDTAVITGTLRDIGSYDRYVEGTWSQGGVDYDFKITRE